MCIIAPPSACRERVLEEAANRPIFSGPARERTLDPNDLYPNVYDSLAKAKMTSAFLGGAKVRVHENLSHSPHSVAYVLE